MKLKQKRWPNGMGISNGDFADYTFRSKHLTIWRLPHQNHAFRIFVFYRYALDKFGRKSVSPFAHSSGGTTEVRELTIWRFGVHVGTHTSIHRRWVELLCNRLGHKRDKSNIYCARCHSGLNT